MLIGSGHSSPDLYDGPIVSVISSNITSSEFSVTLLLSNSTTWFGGSGSVDITSSSAPVIWALGTKTPSTPSDPTSNIQQHREQGVFSINMNAAQFTQNTDTAPNSNGTGNGNDSSSSSTNSNSSSGLPSSPSIPFLQPTITGSASSASHSGSFGLSSWEQVRSMKPPLPLLLRIREIC